MNAKKELRELFETNIGLGLWANAQAIITDLSASDVLEAGKWAGELKDAQDAQEEEARSDEQMKHREEPDAD